MAEKNHTKSFILRVDAETMNAIEAWAADEFRSTNGQLQWIITEALRKAKRLPINTNIGITDHVAGTISSTVCVR